MDDHMIRNNSRKLIFKHVGNKGTTFSHDSAVPIAQPKVYFYKNKQTKAGFIHLCNVAYLGFIAETRIEYQFDGKQFLFIALTNHSTIGNKLSNSKGEADRVSASATAILKELKFDPPEPVKDNCKNSGDVLCAELYVYQGRLGLLVDVSSIMGRRVPNYIMESKHIKKWQKEIAKMVMVDNYYKRQGTKVVINTLTPCVLWTLISSPNNKGAVSAFVQKRTDVFDNCTLEHNIALLNRRSIKERASKLIRSK